MPAPYINTHPIDTFAAAPFSGIFTCSASGYGKLLISWIRKDLAMVDTKPLPVKANVSLNISPEFITSTLVIPNVTTDDVGAYYCLVWAENKASRSNAGKLLFSGMCEVTLHISNYNGTHS